MTDFLKTFSIMKPDSFKVKSLIFSFALLVLVSGCTDEDVETVVVPSAKKVANVEIAEEVMEEVVEVKKETWTSVDIKSNPFATFFRIAEAGDKPRSPLECCDLLQFKISIIISGPGVDKSYATVVDPSNNKIIVNEGMYMGLNRGEVIKINRDGITVREPISDKSGKTVDHIDILLPTVQGR